MCCHTNSGREKEMDLTQAIARVRFIAARSVQSERGRARGTERQRRRRGKKSCSNDDLVRARFAYNAKRMERIFNLHLSKSY